MIDRNLGRERHSPASIPHRVTSLALNEEIAFPGVVVRRGNRERVEVSASDVVLDSVAIEVFLEEVPQGSCI